MKRKVLLFLMAFFSACVTVNIYFPAAAVQRAADKIVDETWGEPKGGEGTRTKPITKNPASRKAYAFSFPSLATEAYAQETDIDVTNPAIRALKNSIKGRSSSIKPFMDGGNAGINKDGLLEIRSSTGLGLRDRADLKQLLEAENRDREALYVEIARANNIPGEKVADIRRIFANSWRDKARDNWWVQADSGKWGKK
jgi:uncharacterized protein YdbL (DUF1318 family)